MKISCAELRYTRDFDSSRSVLAGLAWTRFDLSGTADAPFGPAVTIMPVGRSELWTAYAACEARFGLRFAATLGLVAGNTVAASVL